MYYLRGKYMRPNLQPINRGPNPRFIPVEDVLNIYDERIWWYYIPGFLGYELSNYRHIRSMKHFKKYPFGILIRPKKEKSMFNTGSDPLFELSNNNNERVSLRLSQIIELANNNTHAVQGFPRKTIWSDCSSRNIGCFIKRNITPTLEMLNLSKPVEGPKFTIIEDYTSKKDVIVPIQGIDENTTYYGRT